VVVTLPELVKDSKLGEWVASVTLRLKDAQPWAESGYEICVGEAVVVPRAQGTGWWEAPAQKFIGVAGTQLGKSVGRFVEIVMPNASLTFDRSLGVLSSWTAARAPLVLSGPQLQLWRAPTDNDMYAKRRWRTDGLDKIRHRVNSFAVDGPDRSGIVTVTIGTRAGPPVWDWGVACAYTYTIYPTGDFDLRMRTHPNGAPFPDNFTLPRLGVQLRIPTPTEVQWYGRGPGESYIDTYSAARLGIWRAKSPRDLETDYVTPQENGNRHATRWVRFALGPTGQGFRVLGSPELNFGVKDYETSDLDAAGHRHELDARRKSGYSVVSLDYALNGIGTNSCGPGPLDNYVLKANGDREWVWRFERVDKSDVSGSML
jgi:beta-galactosidase/evolved beta-galactosidase subunit alpha